MLQVNLIICKGVVCNYLYLIILKVEEYFAIIRRRKKKKTRKIEGVRSCGGFSNKALLFIRHFRRSNSASVEFLHFSIAGNPKNGVRYDRQWSRSSGGAYRPGWTSVNARRRSDLGGGCSSVDPNWKAQDQHLHHLLSSKKTYGIIHSAHFSFPSFNLLFLRFCRFWLRRCGNSISRCIGIMIIKLVWPDSDFSFCIFVFCVCCNVLVYLICSLANLWYYVRDFEVVLGYSAMQGDWL